MTDGKIASVPLRGARARLGQRVVYRFAHPQFDSRGVEVGGAYRILLLDRGVGEVAQGMRALLHHFGAEYPDKGLRGCVFEG